jgi:parallel beta-helix repeat protein
VAIGLGRQATPQNGQNPPVAGATVTGVTISSNLINASLSAQSSGAGIILHNAKFITLTQNTIRGGNQVGLALDSRPEAQGPTEFTTISQNSISGVAGDGVFVSDSLLSAVVTRNTVSGNSGNGFVLSEIDTYVNAFNQFSRNEVSNNGGAGFLLFASLGNNLEKNTISGNRDGVFVSDSQDNQIKSNTIQNNSRDGILADQFASGNVFTGNKVQGSGRFDIEDLSSGDGTAGTDNIYRSNKAATANPAALATSKK